MQNLSNHNFVAIHTSYQNHFQVDAKIWPHWKGNLENCCQWILKTRTLFKIQTVPTLVIFKQMILQLIFSLFVKMLPSSHRNPTHVRVLSSGILDWIVSGEAIAQFDFDPKVNQMLNCERIDSWIQRPQSLNWFTKVESWICFKVIGQTDNLLDSQFVNFVSMDKRQSLQVWIVWIAPNRSHAKWLIIIFFECFGRNVISCGEKTTRVNKSTTENCFKESAYNEAVDNLNGVFYLLSVE